MNLLIVAVLVLLAALTVVGLTAETWNASEICLTCLGNQKPCKAPNVGNDGTTKFKIQCCESYDECGLTDEAKPSPYCITPECKWSYGLFKNFSKNYNPETHCCTEDGPATKYPIERVYACRNTLTARKGVKPEPNGCGTKEIPVQSKFGKADFTKACNNHDICYDTCNSGETACNDKFYKEMQAECKRAYPVKGTSQKQCLEKAYDYRYKGSIASIFVGAYDDAQKRVCQCCPDTPSPEPEINFLLPQTFTETGTLLQRNDKTKQLSGNAPGIAGKMQQFGH